MLLVNLLLLSTAALAWQPDYVLRVSERTIASNCQPRLSVVVNGTSPGPLITFEEGQHAWIRVYNDLPHDNTTLHWHGFTQFMSPFSDGTPMVSGWPIPAGGYYDYEFQLEPGHFGTYWYHSHVGMQMHTSAGPIIIKEKNQTLSPVAWDEEAVMMLGDYYTASETSMTAGLLNQTSFHWLGDPQAVVVNGRAYDECNATRLSRGQDCSMPCGVHQQFVKPGRRYRVRVIGATVLSQLSLALEGHNMTLFEVDGTYIKPLSIQDLQISSGQRYSVLIDAREEPEKADFYWRMKSIWRNTEVHGAALWSYNATASPEPYNQDFSPMPPPANLNATVPLPRETFGWVDNLIEPYLPEDQMPTNATRTIYLDTQQMITGPQNQGFKWRVNNVTLEENPAGLPFLLGLYREPPGFRTPNYTNADGNGGLDADWNVYPARLGEVIDVVLQNDASEASGLVEVHPWHFHGRKYWDLGVGPGNFSYEAYEAIRANSTGSPFKRDTSVVYAAPGASYLNSTMYDSAIGKGAPGGWRLIRIQVNDPGAWLAHCHIVPHQVMGMAILLLFGAEALPEIPPNLVQEYFQYNGTAFGAEANGGREPVSYFETVKGGR